MDVYHYYVSPYRYLIFGLVILICSVCLACSSGIAYQHKADRNYGRQLSGGFPLTFVHDATGSSPTGSWGKIDEADFIERLEERPFLIDVLFYALIFWMGWFLVNGLRRLLRRSALRVHKATPLI